MSHANLSTDYATVIADLRAKRDELDRTISMLETMAALSAPSQQRATSRTPSPQDEAAGSGIGDACVQILKQSNESLTTREVTERLLASGFPLQAPAPEKNVWSALDNRAKGKSDVEKVGKHWRYRDPLKGVAWTIRHFRHGSERR